MASAAGVLPAPPTVGLPTQTTGTPALAPLRKAPCRDRAVGCGQRRQHRGCKAASGRHQNGGSRMAAASLQTDLHEIRIERGERPVKRAAEPFDGGARRAGDGGPLGGVGQQRADTNRQPSDVADLLGAARGIKRFVELGEIPDMRAVQHGGTKLDRLHRILSPWLASDPPMNTIGASR